MKNNRNIEQIILCFQTALSDVYRDEEERQLFAIPKLEIHGDDEDITDHFTAMLYAMFWLIQSLADYDGDIIDFTHMLNKLAVMHLLEQKSEDKEK